MSQPAVLPVANSPSIVQKLIMDRYLKFDVDAMNKPSPFQPGDVVKVPSSDYYIEQSTKPRGAKGKTSNILPGVTQKQHRRFRWLPYWRGAVTMVPWPAATDVLTGKMSGCYLTAVTEGGVRYACHIGTVDDPEHPLTKAAKKGWTAYIKQPTVQIVGGFNPSRAFVETPAGQQDAATKTEVEQIFGLFSAAGEFHFLILCPQKDWTLFRIGELSNVIATLPDETLKTLARI